MKKNKFKFEHIEIYSLISLITILCIFSFFFYGFLKINVYNTIVNSEVLLDASAVRISDVNVTKFKEVSKKTENKASSQKVNARNVFK